MQKTQKYISEFKKKQKKTESADHRPQYDNFSGSMDRIIENLGST